MTNSIAEVKHNNCLFVIGSNTTENHPVIASMIKRAKRAGARLIVADPRKIELAEEADIYLQVTPGANIALVNAMCHVIIEEALWDKEAVKARCDADEFEDLKAHLASFTPEAVQDITGVEPELVRQAARLFATSDGAGIYYAMGITQHTAGTHGVMSLSNLALITGNIGRENAGINPLRGQNNVQGACDMGCLPSDLPGYQKVNKPEVIEKFEQVWQRPLSGKVGLTLTEIMADIPQTIKFLYVFGENPAVSDPDSRHVEEALKSVDFLVCQDLFLSETAAFADVVLPACSFAEKDGTFTNTERRVQRVRKALTPIGDSRPDWQIFMELMRKLGYDRYYLDPSEIMDEIRELVPSYAGISYERIEDEGIQWPCLTEDHPGTKYLHKEKISRGIGLLALIESKDPAELVSKDYPYILTTGRNLYHYHTRTMTGLNEGIEKLVGDSYVEISPILASRLGIENGDRIKVASRRGEIQSNAKLTEIIDEDVIFMPFHYSEGANVLTNTAHDPLCKIPELKVCAVKVEKA